MEEYNYVFADEPYQNIIILNNGVTAYLRADNEYETMGETKTIYRIVLNTNIAYKVN